MRGRKHRSVLPRRVRPRERGASLRAFSRRDRKGFGEALKLCCAILIVMDTKPNSLNLQRWWRA